MYDDNDDTNVVDHVCMNGSNNNNNKIATHDAGRYHSNDNSRY